VATPDPAAVRRQALSVGVATALYGVSFGAVAVTSGLSVLQACMSSLLLFSGGSQFALIGVIGSGGSVWAAVAASSLLGVRNGLYALQLNRVLHPRGWRRVAAAQITIDESTAVAVAQDDPARSRLGFWLTGLTVYVGWNLMTFLGALIGSAIGDPRTYGLDAAASAAFLALVWPRLKQPSGWQIALVGAAIDVCLVPVLPTGLPIVAAGLIGLAVGLRKAPA
jgi:predicted branched-subunit amino acid permease